MEYPHARRTDLVETLHGVQVADPYRWLEDAESAATRAWVDAQNVLTRATLDGPARRSLVKRLTGCYDYPRTTSIVCRGGREFFTHNPGLLNQPILHVRIANGAEARQLIDPNTLTSDGTTALTAYVPSPDGGLVAYALSIHGSDRQELRVRDVATARDLDDRLRWVKFASVAWTKNADGFFYLGFPEPGTVPPDDEQYFGRIYFHRLGAPQEADPLVFERPERDVVPLVDVSHSGRWVVVTAQRGASDDSEVYVAEVGGRGSEVGRFVPLFRGFESAYHFIEEAGGRLLFRTTDGAPMGRIVSVDPERPSDVREVVAESTDRLSLAVLARDGIVASYLHNASDQLRAFDVAGRGRGELPLPGTGSIVTLDATPDHDEVRLVWTSFVDPPSAWIIRGNGIALSGPEAGSPRRIHPSPFQTRQVWYHSKDGTAVSMFLVHRADVRMDGARPVLLSGYGGFNISRTPIFDPGHTQI